MKRIRKFLWYLVDITYGYEARMKWFRNEIKKKL